ISYKYALDGHPSWSFTTNNVLDFPHNLSPTIEPLMGFICNRLATPCKAPQETVDACWAAEQQVMLTGRVGQDAADLWNELIASA
ncbi:uncharacterized protein BO80DRAFT_358716, partial [Aspergillus ibericus CBS 121593]